ncbi:RING-CH-type domain-containing protein [Heracleum sosnowskyi]|uniref:RING-CH-type domain-containing protein n=1 Tax=Heracleum sosnowskyi TaxID=360622 RepID=A0AAD8IRX4_9APIA|nr:RING-CH-type domain-containing protein [Heracleum sosnowskyi]
MGDHFVLLVDRLLTESTLEAAIESRNPSKQLEPADNDDVVIDCSSLSDSEIGLSPRKVVECRICQDEDFDSKMETPCSCCGSLKYAHRRCVQKWCNEKGNTMCEICHQQFRPNYTAPPPLFRFGGIPMNLRGGWQISRRDLNNPRLVAMVSTDRNLLSPTYDEYADSTSRRLMCFRSIAAIFMALLILRHTLPIFATGSDNYSFPLFLFQLLLRTLGITFPVYIILRAVTALYGRRQQQVTNASGVSSEDEDAVGLVNLQNQPQSIQVP